MPLMEKPARVRRERTVKKSIVITEADYGRLQRLIETFRYFPHWDVHHLNALEEEIESATIVRSSDVPENLVTMNSRVRVKDLANGREMTYQIVFPKDADLARNRISVLAPIGTALLGYRAGDIVEWQVPAGIRRLQILAVEYQPEAAGAAA
jgi:regulator of nucleoside diphosphate kinase